MEQKPSLEDILRSEEVTPRKGPVKRSEAPVEDRNKKKGKKGRKRTVLRIVLAVLALLLVGAGILAYRILVRPETLFTSSTATVTEAPPEGSDGARLRSGQLPAHGGAGGAGHGGGSGRDPRPGAEDGQHRQRHAHGHRRL